MSRWDKAVVGAVCIACGYAALVLSLVALKGIEDWTQAKNRERS